MSDFDAQVRKSIPAEVNMISGSHDSQTSADVSNVGAFQLPNPQGKAGGACTSALLQVLYKDKAHQMTGQLTWVETLRQMRTVLRGMGYDQVPQLTSSRMIDVQKPMYIVPPQSANGQKRAILIGINYTGQQGQLSGCHNDVKNVKEFLENGLNFSPNNMLILMDDNVHHEPTKQNILNAFERITQYCNAGDVVFLHYSGHGSRVKDQDGDEEDGYDETLVPVDFKRSGQIRDDDILKVLVKPLRAGVTMTCLMDCCHSGTVLDLPYRFTADGDVMTRNNRFDLLNSPEGAVAAACCLYCILDCLLN